MARPPTSPVKPRRSSSLWAVALVVAFVALAAAVVPVAGLGIGAAVAFSAASLLVFALLVPLRKQHLASVAEAARLRAEIREREEEATGRDADWHAYVRTQAEAALQEAEFLVAERVPAALGRGEIPPPPESEEPLAVELAKWYDRLLADVSEVVGDREESQRIALVELASRVQTSAHRIQATVSGVAERHPSDADLLEATMQVDHAATQQARHAQSLKVLCGEWPGQQWQKPLALVDVVRAASGRIVSFKRVEVTGDPDVGVTASVVEPLIHLIAELLANATEYSPPRTSVPVTVRTVQRGAVIEVDDGGLGLDEYRLAEAREVVSGRRLLGVGDVGEIPQTGFAVVGRFAHRHGLGVDLGPSPYGGVRAVILVPLELLKTLAPAGTAGRVLPTPPPAPVPAEATPEAVPPARAPEPEHGPVPSAEPPAREADGPAGHRRLPQRRSRRDGYVPAVEEAPVAVTPPGSPEDAGDWMEQFFEGSRTPPPPAGSASPDHASYDPPYDPSESPDSSEGQK
ncbi:ATP-binding protein [Streptomyces sp. ADI93-02]|uniref:sensor histidine kinase n=1 Tax=Streptomyces sp. ADI93-02 TaxID=1522757 RepID=UPI000F5567F5|nr:ATP-binding protein [Streptomyces sp. ADI93-02]RPK34506.1 Histidine kinase-, DNA gyrase B-, and HSP90-like ATPase [Streptomyces sp. ADI93-02]